MSLLLLFVGTGSAPDTFCNLLTEDGGVLLTEAGADIVGEHCPGPTPPPPTPVVAMGGGLFGWTHPQEPDHRASDEVVILILLDVI